MAVCSAERQWPNSVPQLGHALSLVAVMKKARDPPYRRPRSVYGCLVGGADRPQTPDSCRSGYNPCKIFIPQPFKAGTGAHRDGLKSRR